MHELINELNDLPTGAFEVRPTDVERTADSTETASAAAFCTSTPCCQG